MSITGVTASYLEEFDARFYDLLHQRGSALIQAVSNEPVIGSTKYLRQAAVGDAHFVDSVGSITEYSPIRYARRKLEPKAFECAIMLDKYDMVMQGMPDVGQLAQEASDSCGKLIDQIIIKGIGGPAETESGMMELDNKQTIEYDNVLLGSVSGAQAVEYGLSTSKVALAVQMLRSKFNSGPIICVANNYALATLRADPRAASADFNSIHSLAEGINAPFAGVDAFVASEQIDNGISINKNEPITYAYIYAMDQIKLGSSMPLTLDYGKNAERGLNDVFIYRGMYDCVRMQEDAVIRVEINAEISQEN